ncbi:DUF4303 domain-containing protein [Paenibacillus arenosi]|uniref:DUF4303 domain-containing protein n=1 Tax=Paenibacillus arenosi TaxID=2774142 RepID=A0ABR9AUY2_9BACL|nr:DUF4303 domain-containing protein [Paenibacillus arenosi]MBD8497919.1 DUF4303 domain-containing protein [Paenibacillus arenosi]
MSGYDVHISKLINGRRALEGTGKYMRCTPDQTIVEIDSGTAIDGIVVSAKDVEDALYEYCTAALEDYIAEGNNSDVYTFSIHTDTYHGSYIIYINNLESLNQSVEQTLSRSLQQKNRRNNPTREQLYYEYKYAEGDYSFMYEDMPERLENWLSVFWCISVEEPRHLEIDQNYLFEKTLFDSQLFLIAIDVIQRLQQAFQKLNRTDDFIAYVSAADGGGGDYLTTSQLIRKCVSKEQLYKAMPDIKEMDNAFEQAVYAVQQKPLPEQVKHWVAVIEKGEFGKNSPYNFSKTDYEVYEQLMELGEEAVPCIQEHLDNKLKQETAWILETVLQDQRKG